MGRLFFAGRRRIQTDLTALLAAQAGNPATGES